MCVCVYEFDCIKYAKDKQSTQHVLRLTVSINWCFIRDGRRIEVTREMQHDYNNNKYILCVGQCVLDVIHTCQEYPEEDSDRR